MQCLVSCFLLALFLFPSPPHFSGGRPRLGFRLPSPRGRPVPRNPGFRLRHFTLLSLSFSLCDMGAAFFSRLPPQGVAEYWGG